METKDKTEELSEALLDLLDMLGALAGRPEELYGWGLSEQRQQEIWDLGQRILQEKHGSDL